MSGRAYLESIKKELEAGRHQYRMGESILAGFGYVRRRRSVVDEINFELERLGLHAEPPIGPEMPLRTPRIRFSLADGCSPGRACEPRGFRRRVTIAFHMTATTVTIHRVLYGGRDLQPLYGEDAHD